MSQPPRGIHCPACHGMALVVRSRRRPCAGVRVRYFECVACHARFKSRETLGTLTRGPNTVPTPARRSE